MNTSFQFTSGVLWVTRRNLRKVDGSASYVVDVVGKDVERDIGDRLHHLAIRQAGVTGPLCRAELISPR